MYFRQIIKAFQKLYELKIIHRDIKPANILIKDGICKLADFGVAKIIDDNRNNNVTFKGTIPFMAPQIL
jgi:serine/threonine-protein kinase ULK/ATG1